MSMNFKKNAKSMKIVGLIGGVLIVYYAIHHLTGTDNLTIPLPVVSVQKPQLKEMTEFVTQTGTTVAFNSVDLVARVEGYLDKLEFVDGSFVKQGKELFVIQPEPYWEQLKGAQATVAAAKASYQYAKAEYARQQSMYKEHASSLNSVQMWLAKMEESAAEVDKAEANEAIAAINYSYTHVAAPFDGRIGRHLVDVGNLVGNGAATNIATIEQMDKLYVYFNLNEIDLIKLRNAAKEHGIHPDDINKIPVYVNMQNETGFKHKALFDFVNTGLNASTGTMELRAVLDNKDYLFVPGLFVQVKVAISNPTKQLTVPSTAVLYDQIGAYILLADKDNTVVLRRVTLGSTQEGIQAITNGVTAEDRVIVNGLQNASPGNKVAVR